MTTELPAPAAPSAAPAPTDPAPTASGSDPKSGGTDDGKGAPQAPGSNGTEQKQTLETLFNEDQRKYLADQGVTDLTPEALGSFVDKHKELRAKKETPVPTDGSGVASALEGIQNGDTPPAAPVAPAVPPAIPPVPPVTPPAQPQAPTVQPDNSAKLPSELDIINFANGLASQFPAIKDDIHSGKFFTDMSEFGLAPTVNGQFNVKAAMKFAGIQNKSADLQQQLTEAQKPTPDAVPNVTHEVDDTQPKVADMNETAAMNIVKWSNDQKAMGKPVHPQLGDAQAFMKKNTKI